MFGYSEHVLKICIAQIGKYIGFKSINELAFEILIDLLSRFILNFGKLSLSFANQCNRTQVNLDDICFVIKSLNLNLDDLIDYFEEVKLPFAGPLLPNYPVKSRSTFRIQFPTQSELDTRKEFYQDWQPTINLNNQYLTKLDPQQQKEIETKLDQLDLIDYIEQKRNLKITEDLNLNRKLLNRIRKKVNELNIGDFTDLEAQVPNYIYLSADGQALSFGNKQGRLPEARQHNQIISKIKLSTINNKNKTSNRRSKHSIKSSKRTSNKSSNKSDKEKRIEYQETSLFVGNFSIENRNLFERSELSDSKSEEQIVSDLLDEMISSVDKFNESFYDENEAAKTLVLLSYDSSKSVLSSTAESPSFDGEENQIDYSLSNKLNYDHNNNSSISDLNNNWIDQRKNGHNFSNLIGSKLDKSLSDLNTNDYQFKLNDVKNLTINDAETESNTSLNQKINNNSNSLPKLKFKLPFDKYKETLANQKSIKSITNHELNGHHLSSNSSKKSSKSSDSQQQKTSTKDEQPKRKYKKSNSVNSTSKITKQDDKQKQTDSISTPIKTSNKKNKQTNIPEDVHYYCPTCTKPDNGTPMIACDQCLEWFHWKCQSIFVTPKEDKWYCLNCSVKQSLEESEKLKKIKKKKIKDETPDKQLNNHKTNGKKRTKQDQKQEDKIKIKSHKNSAKNVKEDIYYCPTCSKPDNGTPMVGCDKCDCWFHWKCVGLTTTPQDESWFCVDCKKKKKIKKLKK